MKDRKHVPASIRKSRSFPDIPISVAQGSIREALESISKIDPCLTDRNRLGRMYLHCYRHLNYTILGAG